LKDEQKETVACEEATEANPENMKPHPEGNEANSAELGSAAMYREVPTEDAAVKSSGTMKKRTGVGI
jgi:hypothetical protein